MNTIIILESWDTQMYNGQALELIRDSLPNNVSLLVATWFLRKAISEVTSVVAAPMRQRGGGWKITMNSGFTNKNWTLTLCSRYHCGKLGHKIDRCYALHGRPPKTIVIAQIAHVQPSTVDHTSFDTPGQPAIFNEFLKWYKDRQNPGFTASVAHSGTSFVGLTQFTSLGPLGSRFRCHRLHYW